MLVFFAIVFYLVIGMSLPLYCMEKESTQNLKEEQEKIALWLTNKFINNEDILPFVEKNVGQLCEDDPTRYTKLKSLLEPKNKTLKRKPAEVKKIGGSLIMKSWKEYHDLMSKKVKRNNRLFEAGFCIAVSYTAIAVCIVAAGLSALCS